MIAQVILEAASQLREEVNKLTFGEPVHTIYNPLDYAWSPHRQYIERFGNGPKKVIFLGMNPGPWGMAQVGVPFGEIDAVKSWMNIDSKVHKPTIEHPKRPITGFETTRSEVSGKRLWGLFEQKFVIPERFFQDHFVANYCPLVFMEESGRNYTPDKLRRSERDALYAACDEHLRQIVAVMQPEWVIGVGKFAYDRANDALKDLSLKTETILHPSPASPAANRGWSEIVEKKLKALSIWES